MLCVHIYSVLSHEKVCFRKFMLTLKLRARSVLVEVISTLLILFVALCRNVFKDYFAQAVILITSQRTPSMFYPSFERIQKFCQHDKRTSDSSVCHYDDGSGDPYSQ